jgi:uncharacterized protein (TIGR02996 family)
VIDAGFRATLVVMPGTAAEFLRLILADPDADGPRLVFADWLESQGESDRAEFIRVQCAAAALPPDDPRLAGLDDRAGALLERRRVEWGQPLAGLATRWDWRRGFPEFVRIEAAKFFARGAELFAAVPVGHVELLHVVPYLAELRDSPLLTRLTGLTMAYQSMGGDGLAIAAANAPVLAGLRELDLSRCGITDDGAAILAASPHLTGLRRLSLNGNRLTEAGKRLLLSSSHLRSVVAWDLRENH